MAVPFSFSSSFSSTPMNWYVWYNSLVNYNHEYASPAAIYTYVIPLVKFRLNLYKSSGQWHAPIASYACISARSWSVLCACVACFVCSQPEPIHLPACLGSRPAMYMRVLLAKAAAVFFLLVRELESELISCPCSWDVWKRDVGFSNFSCPSSPIRNSFLLHCFHHRYLYVTDLTCAK